MNNYVLSKLKEWKASPLLFVTECIGATPSNQQAELLAAAGKNKRISIRSGHGCHAANTGIHMYPYGFKLIQDIQVGDKVMGDDSTERNVLSTNTGKALLYRIKYHSGGYYDVDEDHILSLVCTGYKSCYGKKFHTGDKIEVSVKDFLKFPEWLRKRFAGYKVPIEYPEIPVAIHPYILGTWLGDGSSNSPAITSIDVEIIGTWQTFAEANGMKLTTSDDGKTHYCSPKEEFYGVLNSNPLTSALRMYNLIGNKHIPKEYLFNSRENRLQLLAGLIDTDGHRYNDDSKCSACYEFIQKDEAIAQDLVFLAQSCGIHATIREVEKSWVYGNQKNYGNYFKVLLSRNADLIPVRIQRKMNEYYGFRQRQSLHFGFTITPLVEADYYGITVDKNNLYVMDDFTVTHNCGKSSCASWLILHFMSTRPYAKVVCTAPTNRQLADILWSELSKWLRKSILADEFVVQADKIFHKDAPKEYWCRAVSPSVKSSKEDQAETLAGFHGDHLMIVVDEASGVSDPVFIPLEGALTQEDNRVLLIGNPTKNTGYFYDTHFHPEIAKKWKKFHWDSRKSSIVSNEMVTYFAEKYGIDSNVYRIRVAGEPPIDDASSFIPLSWAMQCVGNEIEVDETWPLTLSVDVARFGDDVSIILPRRGNLVMPWDQLGQYNTIELSNKILGTFYDLDAYIVGIDSIGVGGGVVDWLQHDPRGLGVRKAVGVNVAEASTDNRKYHRLRDELWGKVREKCMHGKFSFPDAVVRRGGIDVNLGHELADELSTVKYFTDNNGAIQIESKRDMKARGVKSPNIADSLCISEYISPMTLALWGRSSKAKERPFDRSRMTQKGMFSSDSWMTA